MYFLLFIIPAFAFALVDYYIPFVSAVKLSLSKYDPLSKPKFIGLKNFHDMFKDEVFWISFKNTLLYALYVIPATTVLSFFIAVGLNGKSKIVSFLRVFYFLPMVTSSVAVALTWRWIYNPDYGLLNQVLGIFGMRPIH